MARPGDDADTPTERPKDVKPDTPPEHMSAVVVVLFGTLVGMILINAVALYLGVK